MNFGYRQSQTSVETTSKKGPGILIPLLFTKSIFSYVAIKLRETVFFSFAGTIAFVEWLNEVKSWAVRKMFWGRSSFYKTAIHAFVGVVTLAITLTGISSRLDIFRDESSGVVLASGIIGSSDVLLQEGTAESIVPSDPNQLGFQVFKHTVQKGETLSTVGSQYGISVDTIKWANNISSNTLAVGQVLDIPEIDGVLYTVKKGDSVAKVAKTTKGNEIDIIELNNLDGENPALSEGQRLFVPFGSIEPPPVVKAAGGTSKSGTYTSGPATGVSIPVGTFIRPLPAGCGKWSRGFTYYHGGVDIAQNGGCWERAAAPGLVVVAGWRGAGQGFMVEIDHGTVNGKNVRTRYYHGNGNYRVKQGDRVAAGQDVMYMGCTGRCTGTHLHFEVVIDGRKVNPENYVKLR